MLNKRVLCLVTNVYNFPAYIKVHQSILSGDLFTFISSKIINIIGDTQLFG